MTFKTSILFFTLISSSASAFAQPAYRPTYLQLKEYEGMYEYVSGSTLKIAASPKDTILFAVINKSTYPLRPYSNDVFLNSSKDQVRFYRNNQNTIAGYVLNNDSFKLLSR